MIAVHLDYIFSVGRKARRDQFGRDLNRYIPITNLGELRSYAGCVCSRNLASGTITISQRAAAEIIVAKVGVTRNKAATMVVGLNLDM